MIKVDIGRCGAAVVSNLKRKDAVINSTGIGSCGVGQLGELSDSELLTRRDGHTVKTNRAGCRQRCDQHRSKSVGRRVKKVSETEIGRREGARYVLCRTQRGVGACWRVVDRRDRDGLCVCVRLGRGIARQAGVDACVAAVIGDHRQRDGAVGIERRDIHRLAGRRGQVAVDIGHAAGQHEATSAAARDGHAAGGRSRDHPGGYAKRDRDVARRSVDIADAQPAQGHAGVFVGGVARWQDVDRRVVDGGHVHENTGEIRGFNDWVGRCHGVLDRVGNRGYRTIEISYRCECHCAIAVVDKRTLPSDGSGGLDASSCGVKIDRGQIQGRLHAAALSSLFTAPVVVDKRKSNGCIFRGGGDVRGGHRAVVGLNI